jgi:UDP-GlcNAc:polypeptide alpha-N-acetylglucosaminyltransferase
MSTRLWTHGYDIFSPAQAVLGHMYVRQGKPKFWQSVNRAGMNQERLEWLVLQRIHHQLGYPEAARDMIQTQSILTGLDLYGMGTDRPLKEYLDSVGIDVVQKEITITGWCESGQPPPGKEEYAHLYPVKVVPEKKQPNAAAGRRPRNRLLDKAN